MANINSTARLFSINNSVILTQTDTTVGFLSQNESRLQKIKERESHKPFIKVYKDFKALQKENVRIPKKYKSKVRRAKKTTFVVKGLAFRVATDTLNSQLLQHTRWNYSTSANERQKNFQRDFCEQKADIIIEDKNSLFEGKASKLYRVNHTKIVRLR